ncbi:MAG: hypothetical protein HGA30_08515 [Anaerolineales bacterium]|nr:hypothetical protein [Anaerolineales bacterium]
MKPMRHALLLSAALALLSACTAMPVVGSATPSAAPVDTSVPILTATPPPFPTFTPTVTLMPPVSISGFPYTAALNETLPTENLVLAVHFYSDMVGHLDDEVCYDIGVYTDDSYIAISCLDDFTYPAPNGQLNAYQSKFLHRWVNTFQSFEDPSIHGLLTFTGLGGNSPDYSDRISMQALLDDLEWDAHGYVHQGGYPPVVFHARTVLSTRLNMWLDNSAILKFEAVDYPDSCLGAPKPEEICEQGVTRGFWIQFVVQGLLYEYHTDVFGYDIRQFGEPQIAPTPGPVG